MINDSLFSQRFIELKALSALYVIALILSHAIFPIEYVWGIAVFFSITMNFTYPWAAYVRSQSFNFETYIALGLITLSIAGVLISPLCVIAAIFLHGCWDVAKHKGAGVPFLKWYTLGCVSVDWVYSIALLVFYISL